MTIPDHKTDSPLPDQVGPRRSQDLSGPIDSQTLVTVVLPARNEHRTIAEALASIQRQTYSNLQILVVDGLSEDDTVEIVRRIQADDERIEILNNPDRAIPFAMNTALDAAKGEILVRVDAHSSIPADYVGLIVERFSERNWGGVGGRKDAVGHGPAGRAIAAVMGSKFAQGNSVYHYGQEAQTVDHIPFGAYPVALARALGGWSETQLVNEDFEFDYRLRQAGHELLFDPLIRIDWDCRQQVGDLFKQYLRYGEGKVQTLQTHPESLAVRNLAAPILVAGLAGGSVLLAPRRTRVLGLVAWLSYLAVLGLGYRDVAPKVDKGERRWILPAFASIHIGWGLGVWRALWRSRSGRAAGSHMEASAGTTRL